MDERTDRNESAFWQLLREGQTCEIRTDRNDLIFLGKLHLTEQRAVVEVTESAGQPVPPVLYNTRVKVKVYGSVGSQLLEASVCGSSRHFWRLEHLRPLHAQELRKNFRQRVSVSGQIVRVPAAEAPVDGEVVERAKPIESERPAACRLEDLSLGGVQLRCRERYAVGDMVAITSTVLSEEKPFQFDGQVCWYQEAERGDLLYGCRFMELEEKEQGRLLQAIFTLQRKDLQSRRRG